MTNKPIVFFDLETTGLDVSKDKIIQIAIVKTNFLDVNEHHNLLINPGIAITPEAFNVHNISNNDLLDKPKFSEVAEYIFSVFNDCHIGGFNILHFDLPLLTREFQECNILFPVITDDIKFVDVQKLFFFYNPRHLTDCYKFYTGKKMVNAHDALADTVATVDCFYNMLYKIEDLKNNGPDVLSYIHKISLPDDFVDFSGKLIKDDKGTIYYNFGKYKGKKVIDFPDYARWMISSDFPSDTKKHLQNLIK